MPVLPEGFVLKAENGGDSYSESLPWWLLDMCPQGYLGRLFAHHQARKLKLPKNLSDWSDAHVLQALQQHGDDLPGDLVIGEQIEARLIRSNRPKPIPLFNKAAAYASIASAAEARSLQCAWVAGEQPKFTAYVETEHCNAHVIVQFCAEGNNAMSERWRDLLLAEHHALEVLGQSGLQVARSRVIDYSQRRFLEIERFDRLGAKGRVGLLSLAAFDVEFVGTNGR